MKTTKKFYFQGLSVTLQSTNENRIKQSLCRWLGWSLVPLVSVNCLAAPHHGTGYFRESSGQWELFEVEYCAYDYDGC